jgi:hypothetical protein
MELGASSSFGSRDIREKIISRSVGAKKKTASSGGLKVQLVLGLSAFPLSFLVFPVAIRATTLLLVGFHVVILTPVLVLLLLLRLLFILAMLTLTTLAELSALVSFVSHVEFSFALEFNAFVRCKIFGQCSTAKPSLRELLCSCSANLLSSHRTQRAVLFCETYLSIYSASISVI